MTIFWALLLVALIIVEASTTQLVSIWFAAGALAALIVSFFGEHVEWIEVIVFVVVSALALVLTRPLVKKITKAKIQPTNADMCIGKTAVITQTVDNTAGTGQANLGGSSWSVRSANDEIIEVGDSVTVEAIRGVKLVVTKIKE
ncbi:MAG: NfeD family protein [Clostridiales bacterium]|jgi:membrane protein implicated in regulation of membrane protease activity|nr:NfeD family protein [Clostridiales bacterium]